MAFDVATKVRSGAGDLVAWPNAEDEQSQIRSWARGAARQGQRVRYAGDGGELGLERVDVRAKGRDPVRAERVGQQFELVAGEVRRGEVDAGHVSGA